MGGDTSLAETFFAHLINSDAGPRWVFHDWWRRPATASSPNDSGLNSVEYRWICGPCQKN